MNGVNDWIERVESGRRAHPSVFLNRPQGRTEDAVTWGASTHYGDNAMGRNGMGAGKQAAEKEPETPSRWSGAWRGAKGGLRGGALGGGLAGAGSALVQELARGNVGDVPLSLLAGGVGGVIGGGLSGSVTGAIVGAIHPDPAAEEDLPWYQRPTVLGAMLGTAGGVYQAGRGLIAHEHGWGDAAEGAALSGLVGAGAGWGVSKANERYRAQQAEKSAFVGTIARRLGLGALKGVGGSAVGSAGGSAVGAAGAGVATKAAPSLLRKATTPALSAASLGSSMATMHPTAATFAPVKY